MAPIYNNDRGGYSGGSRGGGSAPRASTPPAEIKAEKLPADYVDRAERILYAYLDPETGKSRPCISTSKLRNLMSLSSDLYNKEILRTESRMSEGSLAGVNQMRIRAAYECGRDAPTKEFVGKARLLEYLKWLSQNHENSRSELIEFAHYMEALVAYHRFYGLKGKED
ncbi:MAG: type III-A CRISPR-associated protein Csm2 [Faecalibacterium sp.]